MHAPQQNKDHRKPSLRSKCFRLVRNRIFGFGYTRNETRAIFCAVFDSFSCTEMLATQTAEKTLFSYQFGLY